MKKVLYVILIVLSALTVLAAAGVLLYRHFVTDRIMDGGDMTNPFLAQEEVQSLPSASRPEDYGEKTISPAHKTAAEKEEQHGTI